MSHAKVQVNLVLLEKAYKNTDILRWVQGELHEVQSQSCNAQNIIKPHREQSNHSTSQQNTKVTIHTKSTHQSVAEN
ncbi:hypothetical protein E2C01_002618 [Portunus trituberculatus]|uniref:Uncharacterized protein n=1 Tax=Portunus trituberculatus TaxID=210409 RepID=A0A5B7CMM8_PORTR|nr:hypothetical protein [Portunus trituberculatus]